MLKIVKQVLSELSGLSNKVSRMNSQIGHLQKQIETQNVLIGNLQTKLLGNANSIQESEFKVFSQFGDDGIIQYLIQKIGVDSKSFIE